VPVTGTESDPGSIRWLPEMSCHIELMDISKETSPSTIFTSYVLIITLWKCLRIRNRLGTGPENDPGSIRWKPEMSCHIEFMDISKESSSNPISTSYLLNFFMLEVFNIQEQACDRCKE
jgi:hypothetical protein